MALTENGPYRPLENGSVVIDEWSWNRNANMIFLESPAGVGFSYSTDPNDYKEVNDTRTASDSFHILLQIYDLFPQFRNNPLWITGESYGGHYVPELTDLIANDPQKRLPIAGLQVGNAWTYMPIDNAGALQTWTDRALVPLELTDNVRKACNLSDVGPLLRRQVSAVEFMSDWSISSDSDCNDAINAAMGVAFGDVNIYDIYVDECNISPQAKRLPIGTMKARYLNNKGSINPPVDPCIDTLLSDYLNRADVQDAFNVPTPTKWHECSPVVQYSYASIQQSVIPVYLNLMKHKLHILVYSGDVDAIVPYAGSRAWTKGLNLPVLEYWRSWHVSDKYGKQTGGFVEKYDGLTFATVRNAGHEVPFYQPKRAYFMFNSFLTNQTLPK